MSLQQTGAIPRRQNPFTRAASPSATSVAPVYGRPKSTMLTTPTLMPTSSSNTRDQSHSHHNTTPVGANQTSMPQNGRKESRNKTPTSNTFAPSFITTDNTARDIDAVHGIEGENDFSGKRYVWLKHPQEAFVKGWIVEDLSDNRLLVQVEDGSQREVDSESVDKANPAKFDRANDMAELTHLNEASVVHNLRMRYQADLIYTYSGLFLVTVNPYCPLPIYTNEYINMYKGRSREDTKPHIYAIADEAFRNLVDEGRNQSILVTGESGAGKTENTKKVIQYLAAVAQSESTQNRRGQHSNLSQQILRANPILEAFGNAQTVRNHNSSRFGKFIRIEFSRSGAITGAFIDWYLLEKSRVVRINAQERNYHIFYQLLKGADDRTKRQLLLDGYDVESFSYTRNGNDCIVGVSDSSEWNSLMEAFDIMGFSQEEQGSILRTVAAVLHLGNIEVVKESRAADQASLAPNAKAQAGKVCELLGVPVEPFLQGLLHPRVKAGREWVDKVQTPDQVRLALDALSKGIYERGFGDLVARINQQLDRSGMSTDDSCYIGVLDIAGFEIFEQNSFEQLCINYTNEKLQQFFNHHMFVLEQEEYAREQIEWQFIDFGRDLQPTIDLIELSNPIGIFSCLDEDCVMPKATDKSFTEKLNSLWDRKTTKYRPSRLGQGFVLTHYAAEVEYSTEDWLDKNKDPLNDNITRLLAASNDKHVAQLFADCAATDDELPGGRNRVKKGLFRTVAQRHKEQLHHLMSQLHSTHPHFVRCILPNHKKRPKMFSKTLVLDQLRCNGVLEGIRIARTGFPNRLSFSEFRHRYEVLCSNMPKDYQEGQAAATIMLEKLNLDKALYRVGITKVFFRAGVLAELEEQRDALITEIMSRFQSIARGFTQRRAAYKKLFRTEATRIIQRNFHVYLGLVENPWWQLIVKMKPLLGTTRTATEVKKRDAMIQQLNEKIRLELDQRQKLEDDRRNAHGELIRIQQTLESERALALDKEEIFKRLRLREAELEEKLSGAIEDQERLEDELDEIMQARDRAETDLENYRAQLDQAAALIGKLEQEKGELSAKAAELESTLRDLSLSQSKRSEQETALEAEIKMLQSQVALKERKTQDLENKLLKIDQNYEIKLHAAQKEIGLVKSRESRIVKEHSEIQKQLSNLSKTSTEYEELVRRKESELVLLRGDKKQSEAERRGFEAQKKSLTDDLEKTTAKFREVQAQMVGMRAKEAQLEIEAENAKHLLATRLTEDTQANEDRQLLDRQVQDLKEELYKVQMDLSRERQSRDDVLLLGEHKYEALKDEFDIVNESKIIIEKELYVQQDALRRHTESRKTAEKERDEAREEIRKLRVAKAEAEETRVRAEENRERLASRAAREREDSILKDLDAAQSRLQWFEEECARLNLQIEDLNKMMLSSGDFGLKTDQAKERMERELHTVKSRLTASENDNRALLNKLQQKGLEIARSTSRASEASRGQVASLQRDKSRLEGQNLKLDKQLDEAQVTIATLEKKTEKLQLDLEDLNHEIAREMKTSRSAEKTTSGFSVQLAEANRTIESERQLRTQAQSTVRTLQASLDTRDREIDDLRSQMLTALRTVDPFTTSLPQIDGNVDKGLLQNYDLVRRVEELQQNLRVQTAARTNAENQLAEARATRNETSSRPKLEEISVNEAPFAPSPLQRKQGKNALRRISNSSVTNRRLPETEHLNPSSEQIPEVNLVLGSFDPKTAIDELQSQLQLAQVQNRHLQSQLERATPVPDSDYDGRTSSIQRMQKLEKANGRLHDMLDDSARKVSTLEKNIRTGELSLRDIQARSHEELLDTFNSQEESRRALLHSHKDAVAELTDIKSHFDKMRHERAKLEVELRDSKSDLQEMTMAREQESQNRSQLLQEHTDLQIRLDAESSKLSDVQSSLDLYKARADEYFSKLEQAEIAVLKASRAEQFAKSQAKETEQSHAEIMAERQKLDNQLEDLQRQNQRLEEKVEDIATDLDAATQAKRRLQNELEDYRSQRAMDIEDKESSMEQTRKKYQAEFATLTNELDLAREEKLYKQTEIARLREELDELRSKWDDEVLNSSTWSKEKARLESTLADVSASREEAANAHSEAQCKVVSLLSQVRTLRSSLDELTSERDLLLREKRSLESRLDEAKTGLDELVREGSPSLRDAATLDRELLDLKSKLAKHEDIATAAVEKMRRAEALVAEMQKEVAVERDNSAAVQTQKAAVEKSLNEAQLKVVDLETKGFSSASQDIKFLHKRIHELESQLELHENERSQSQRSVRNVDRVVKDLQIQIDRKDKQNTQLSEDVNRMRDKVDKLLKTIDELQASESANQLSSRRAERELREEKEKLSRLERELDSVKSLKGSGASVSGSIRSRVSAWRPTLAGDVTMTDSESSINRAPSLTKGFL